MELVSEAIVFAVITTEEIEKRFRTCVRELVESETSAWLAYNMLTEHVFGKGE